MAIGKKVGSIEKLKQDVTRGSSGSGDVIIRWISEDGLIVRFLEDPTEWYNYNVHFDEVLKRSFPCIGDNCPGCAQGLRKTARYLCNALDVETDEVIPLELPKSLTSQLVTIYDRKDTLMDRDYELIREGTGMDTTYSAIPEAPQQRKLSRYDLHDLQDKLDSAYRAVFDVDDDDEDEAPRKPKPKKSKKKAPVKKRRVKKTRDEDDPF